MVLILWKYEINKLLQFAITPLEDETYLQRWIYHRFITTSLSGF